MSVLALLMAVLPALVLAYPGFGGGRGLLRVQNALVEDEAGLTISAHGLGRNAMFYEEVGPSNKKGWVLDLIAPELSYAPIVTKFAAVELFGSWGGVFQTPKGAAQEGFIMSVHDLKAGGKLSIPILPVLKLGFTGNYTFQSGRDKFNWLDKYALPRAGDTASATPNKFAWAGLMTLQLQDLYPAAPNLMFNLGRINEETRYGLGIELAGRGFALFGEMLSRQPTAAGVSKGMFDLDTGHVYLTPGVVFGNVSAVSLTAAYSFALGHKSNNELILGLSIATPFGARPKPRFGGLAGTVTDEKTGAALIANVEFPDNDQVASLSTGSDGVFEVKKIRTGVSVVAVGAPGYQSQSVPLEIKMGATTTHDFKLRSMVAYGVVAGQVLDAVDKKPLNARIEFPKSTIAAVNSDQAGGAFRVNKVPTGVYTVTATLAGYFTGSQTVTVEDGKVANVLFNLTPAGMTSTLTGKVSDRKTGEALAARISFPGTSVASVNTDAGTGVYKTELPVGSYTVMAEADGYIKQTAAVVIEKGKPQVKDFQLVKEGMSITLKGVYFDFDKSTIKPESRPALEAAAQILNENPTINVEIQGHTDSRGSDSYNLALSDRRAGAVVSYLVQNLGIARSRLTSRGYGESQPVETNETDAGRAVNRRVEFVILGQQK